MKKTNANRFCGDNDSIEDYILNDIKNEIYGRHSVDNGRILLIELPQNPQMALRIKLPERGVGTVVIQ